MSFSFLFILYIFFSFYFFHFLVMVFFFFFLFYFYFYCILFYLTIGFLERRKLKGGIPTLLFIFFPLFPEYKEKIYLRSWLHWRTRNGKGRWYMWRGWIWTLQISKRSFPPRYLPVTQCFVYLPFVQSKYVNRSQGSKRQSSWLHFANHRLLTFFTP